VATPSLRRTPDRSTPIRPLRAVRVAARVASALALVATLVLAACSDSTSSSAGTTGSTCTTSTSCGGGLCATSNDFPNGYCTQGCTLGDPASCPSGSVCIDDASGVPADAGVKAVCYQACQTDANCSIPGFKCLEKASKLVCRNGA
jgi:hypothetical protein